MATKREIGLFFGVVFLCIAFMSTPIASVYFCYSRGDFSVPSSEYGAMAGIIWLCLLVLAIPGATLYYKCKENLL